jgi:hypothetical protein
MQRIGATVIVLVMAVFVMPCLAREPMTLAVVKERAAADSATPEGKAYLKQFFTNPWMLALDAASEQCRAEQARSASHDEFVLALVIGDNGYPTDALASPDDDGLRCMADRLKATGFIKPPHDGFAIYMPYRKTEPGTEHQQAQEAPGND